ncbi:hypothetical protein [Gordonia sp. KTR9]|uniref:hypothetical protein n=1 Tax=Gordonia sp. KTR9 TaxID=337191 RepID=UPI0002EECBE6|nr:hypothetical protein [Gordonia sp. KTR9]
MPLDETPDAHVPQPPLRSGDLSVSILLWLIQGILALITFLTATLTAFVTDACAYEACGNPVWTEVAVGTAIVSAVGLLVVSVTLVVRRIRRRIPAWPAAAWCCAIQLVMIFVVLEIGRQAGTLD